jgi:uncharacterized membrane protein YebE (DUF533 family)
MALRHILGTMLASRMAGRGGRRGGMLGSAAMLGMLGGRRRGGMGGKLGLAALGYMAYQAYQGQGAQAGQAQAGQGQGGQDARGQGGQGQGGSGGGLSGLINDIADRLGVGNQDQGQPQQAAPTPSPEEVQAAESYSDEKALLLIRAMIAAAHADGQISPVERSRILQQLQSSGADSEDRRVVEREMENPRPHRRTRRAGPRPRHGAGILPRLARRRRWQLRDAPRLPRQPAPAPQPLGRGSRRDRGPRLLNPRRRPHAGGSAQSGPAQPAPARTPPGTPAAPRSVADTPPAPDARPVDAHAPPPRPNSRAGNRRPKTR